MNKPKKKRAEKRERVKNHVIELYSSLSYFYFPGGLCAPQFHPRLLTAVLKTTGEKKKPC